MGSVESDTTRAIREYDRVGPVPAGVRCAACDHDLGTLSPDSRCPHCGSQIADSVDAAIAVAILGDSRFWRWGPVRRRLAGWAVADSIFFLALMWASVVTTFEAWCGGPWHPWFDTLQITALTYSLACAFLWLTVRYHPILNRHRARDGILVFLAALVLAEWHVVWSAWSWVDRIGIPYGWWEGLIPGLE